MIGVGLVGTGLMGRKHAETLSQLPSAHLIAIADSNAEQREAAVAEFRCDGAGSLAELFVREDIQAVTIATPTDTHCEIAMQALAAGKHVFVEKPITRLLVDAQRLVETAKELNLVLGVGHVIRYFPEYRAIKKAIDDGMIGTPAVATFGRRCQQPDWAPDHWHTTGSRSGGVVVDMMIHDVDLVRWYFGEPSRVYARTLGPDRYDGLDYAVATLDVPNGPICHLHGSWAEPEGFSQVAEVCGSGGMIDYDSRTPEMVQLARHGAKPGDATALPGPPPGTPDPFALQYEDFFAAIAGTGELPGTGEWALQSLEIALAMVESSDTGKPIELSGVTL